MSSLKEAVLKQLVTKLVDSANQLRELHYTGKSQTQTQVTQLEDRVSLAEISEAFDSLADLETEQETLSFLSRLVAYRQGYLAKAIPPELIN